MTQKPSGLRAAWDRSAPLRVLVVVVGLLGLSVWATWPLVPHLGEFVDEDDPYVSAWSLWWTAHALTHFDNPWYTHSILAPSGSYLSYHALVPLLGVLASPLTLSLGAGLTYNVLKLVLGPLAAVTGYALARTLGLTRWASWVVGCLWGFSTITLWRTAYHLNFGAGMVLLPVTMAFAVRYERDGRARDACLLGAGVGALVLVDPTMALFAAMAIAVWLVVNVIGGSGWRRWGRGLLYALPTGLLVGLPQLVMMMNASRAGGYEPNLPVLASTWVGADTNVHTMLSPGNVRAWFPGGLEHRAYRYPWGEATPAYGWGALLLGGAAVAVRLLAVARRRRSTMTPLARRAIVWGLIVFAMGSLFALGPELTLRGRPYTPLPVVQHGQTLSALMPYTWLVQFRYFRTCACRRVS